MHAIYVISCGINAFFAQELPFSNYEIILYTPGTSGLLELRMNITTAIKLLFFKNLRQITRSHAM